MIGAPLELNASNNGAVGTEMKGIANVYEEKRAISCSVPEPTATTASETTQIQDKLNNGCFICNNIPLTIRTDDSYMGSYSKRLYGRGQCLSSNVIGVNRIHYNGTML